MNLRTAATGIPAYILSGPPTIQQVKHLKDSVLPAPTTQTHSHTRSRTVRGRPRRRARPSPRQTTLLSLLCVRRSGAAGAVAAQGHVRDGCGSGGAG